MEIILDLKDESLKQIAQAVRRNFFCTLYDLKYGWDDVDVTLTISKRR